MKRLFIKDGKTTNERLTDELLEKANAIVDEEMNGKTEDRERECHICNERWFPNEFNISCRTSFDYRVYKFRIEDDGNLKYLGMEGDFR